MLRKELIKYAEKVANNASYSAWVRLRSCNAEYLRYYDIAILKSYRTIVAIADLKNSVVYAFDYYSPTTCQHVRKFCDEMHAFNLVKLYKDSTKYLDIDLEDSNYSYKPKNYVWDTIIKQDFVNVLLDHFTDEQFERYLR